MSFVADPTALPTVRRWAILAALVALLAAVPLIASGLPAVQVPIPIDYYQYWAAGWLVARGENPYDPARLWEVEAAGGMVHPFPIMTWHPPWALALTLPFGLLPPGVGCVLWVALQAAAVLAAAALLWHGCGGAPDRRWVAWALTLGFTPTLALLATAQVTGFCLLGVAGFLAAMRADRPVLAGAALALTAIKPHLLALLGLAVILQSLRDGKTRRAALTGAGVLVAANLVVAAFNPLLPAQYLRTLTNQSGTNPYRVEDVPSPTLGWHLRDLAAPESFAVSLMPLAALAAATVALWWAHRRRWDWPAAAPWLVLGSMMAPTYGAWLYDLPLLLVPVVAVAARLSGDPRAGAARWVALGWFAAVSLGVFVALKSVPNAAAWTGFVVVTPAVAAGVSVVGLVAGWWGRGADAGVAP